ncbi:hypothetical protein CASFOL_028746 [Castilleja foliolosa]|uniref:F-box domain-containing protein n=1 Tax=Castilleja foliolosa TaxID=1961234 RepID=A0ABD3CC47_9LAMI
MPLSNKRIKETPSDRFSELPDSLIIHILSFLEVKQSVVTAVLSKRWINLWRESPRLVFKEKSKLPDKIRDFVGRVNRTLLAVSGDRNCLNTLEIRFSYKYIYRSDVDVWLEFAIRNNVKKLNVVLDSTPSSILDVYSLPQMMFHNSNLEHLILFGCVVAPRRTIEWRSLIRLTIGWVELQQHVIDKILSGCPVLYDLTLSRCWGFNHLELESKSLHKLSVHYRKRRVDQNKPLLRISAPYLHSLGVALNVKRRKLSLGNTSSLVKASIDFIGSDLDVDPELDVDTEVMDNAKELLEKIRHVKYVEIRGCCSQVLSSLAMTGYQFPQSARTSLLVKDWTEKLSIHGILGLLESSPNLEALVIEGLIFVEEPIICQDPKGDLSCDLLHLKTITLKDFVHPSLYGEPMLTLARILLNKTPALEKMNIIGIDDTSSPTPASGEPFKIAQTLLSYPRSSVKAVVVLN